MTLSRTVLCTLAVIASIANVGAPDVSGPKFVVYLGATLLDGTVPPRVNTAIVTRGDRVVAVQSAEGFHAEQGQEVVDVHDTFVIPGLINTHVHLATLAEPLVAKAYLRRELYSGVTTVRDMAGDSRLLGELKREAEFDEIASPDIFFVALMAGPEFFVDPRTHDAARGRVAGQVPWMQAITPDTNLQLAVAEALGTGATAIKIYGDLPGSLVKTITAEAHRQHMLVWAHAAVLPALPSEVVSAGVDVISHACLLGYEVSSPPVLSFEERRSVDASKVMHPNPQMDALLETIRRRGTILDATLYAFEGSTSIACPPGTNDYIAGQAYRAGIPISTGTDDDAEWKDPDSALDTELELLVVKVGMTPAEVLRAATVIGARTVGLEKDLGSIEAGRLANMVVLRKNPLENIANVRSVVMVVKHGIRYLHSDYKPVTAEELKHRAE
jgi:imidazolonepropionase-like amidohydrolase